MKPNVESIRAKLLAVSKEKKIVFQDLLNRYGAEQFLVRLSDSPYLERFIFKGGSLLTYLIETDRRTQDLDFSIRKTSYRVSDALEVVKKILAITFDDGLTWLAPQGASLHHPEMDYPGVRIKCGFKLGTAKGLVRMDLAFGDIVEARKISLERIQYRGKPIIGSDFVILAYPPETIFAEKLQIAVKRGERNTRMKDYYDLFKLIQSKKLEPAILRKSIEKTFSKRTTDIKATFTLADDALEKLETYWAAYIRKMKIADAPKKVADIAHAIHRQLKAIYDE